jgi:hypothetical protein
MHGPTYRSPVHARTLVPLASKFIDGIAVGYSFTPMKRRNSAQQSVKSSNETDASRGCVVEHSRRYRPKAVCNGAAPK